jgi:hypothetical protein
MAAAPLAELAFFAYCDVSYAGARALVEAIEWHKSRGHTVVSESLGLITECGIPCVPLPHIPSATVSVSTVSVNGRALVS